MDGKPERVKDLSQTRELRYLISKRFLDFARNDKNRCSGAL